MTRRDIMGCTDIEKLKALCLEYRRQLSYISEVLVDVSKWHISANGAVTQMRDYLVDNQYNFAQIMEKEV